MLVTGKLNVRAATAALPEATDFETVRRRRRHRRNETDDEEITA
jgi:hypothetical protein